jgi:MtfA peptidase
MVLKTRSLDEGQPFALKNSAHYSFFARVPASVPCGTRTDSIGDHNREVAIWRKKRSEALGIEWHSVASKTLNRWSHLTDEEVGRAMDHAETFTRGRYWEGLDGLEITPSMRAVISVQACLLATNIGLNVLDDVSTVLLAPGSTYTTTRHVVGGSIVSESEATVIGQAALHGPVRLAWNQVLAETDRRSDTSVVIHEFAHKVDMADGVSDGNPPIRGHERSLVFERVLGDVLDKLREDSGGTSLRSYGATNRAELFAVATEAFFLRPEALMSEFKDLYRVFVDFYMQDPARQGISGDPR